MTFGFRKSQVANPLMPAFGSVTPWAAPALGNNAMGVVRLLKPIDPVALGAKTPIVHKGVSICPLGLQTVWMPDPQTMVIGIQADVEAAIDRPERESRFPQFDFAGRGGQILIVAVNRQQPAQANSLPSPGQTHSPGILPGIQPGMPVLPPAVVALQKLPESMRIKSRGGSLRLDFSSRIEARIAIACHEAPLASELQQELQSALSGLLPELEKLAGNPMFQQMLAPARSILNSVNVTQSGDAVNVQLQIEKSVIEQAMQSLPSAP